ncbi:hypothetical protein WA026_007092 [Henosepilachna vigintioctopunctata]|uniref:CH-like domain-containing protein n=1 Tax=Henosepilachna vigintioctopunctata TaxID=420089 RepID=A0AAW1V822_9CUCU
MFSVPLAEILKQHFPKLVELHNYTPTNSYSNKLANWDTLNRKVLSKIRLPLSREVMEQLARSKQGVIEGVLHDIKLKVESKGAGDQNNGSYYDLSGSQENVRRKGYKTLPISEFEKLEKDLLERDETIQILKQKLEHSENLLKIKEERINDLNTQLENMTETDLKCSASPRTRFFARMF